MRSDEIEKNKLDLKYSTRISIAIKSLGLAVTIPIALASVSFLRRDSLLLTRLSFLSFGLLMTVSITFFLLSKETMNSMDSLVER